MASILSLQGQIFTEDHDVVIAALNAVKGDGYAVRKPVKEEAFVGFDVFVDNEIIGFHRAKAEVVKRLRIALGDANQVITGYKINTQPGLAKPFLHSDFIQSQPTDVTSIKNRKHRITNLYFIISVAYLNLREFVINSDVQQRYSLFPCLSSCVA